MMDIEKTDNRDQQIESFTSFTQGDLWNEEQKETIVATLSKKFPNRVHTEALGILKGSTADAQKNGALFRNMREANLFQRIAEIMCEEHLNAAELSSAIFVNVATFGVAFLEVVLPLLLLKLKQLPADDDNYGVLRLRFLFLFSQISAVSEPAYLQCQSFGCLDQVAAAFDVDDVLEALNVIETLQIIGSTPYGLKFLIDRGLAEQLVSFVRKDDDGAGGLLRDKCLAWVLHTCRNVCKRRELLTERNRFDWQKDTLLPLLENLEVLPALESYFEHGNPIDGVIVLGAIGASATGLARLLDHPNFLTTLFTFLHDGVEMKICVLSAVTEIFEKRVFPIAEEDLSNLEKFYDRFTKENEVEVTEYLFDSLKNPILELRIAVYALLQALVRYGFAIGKLSNTPGLLDHLLTRDCEVEYEGNTWKFVIFQRLVEHPKSKEILGSFQYLSCVEYLKRGIYWKKTENMVDIEDSHM